MLFLEINGLVKQKAPPKGGAFLFVAFSPPKQDGTGELFPLTFVISPKLVESFLPICHYWHKISNENDPCL